MRIDINVHPTETTQYGLAKTDIVCTEVEYTGNLDLNFLPLIPLGNQSTIATDLIFLAAVVYSVDKIILRKHASDTWTRELEVHIPVENLDQWNQVKESLQECLSFLTGDTWCFHFTQLATPILSPQHNVPVLISNNPSVVSLFSGGLDSLIGVINWLEENNGEIILASHYDGQSPLPKSDQNMIFPILEGHYPGRLQKIQVRAGQNRPGKESTFRSRSFLFLSIGLYIASSYNPGVPLLVPENATIGINVPLTPSRRGSCSTRTTHPNFLKQYCAIVGSLGITNRVYNPLDFLTKGECVEQCRNRQVLEETVMQSVSCGKRGHKRWWVRRDAKGCGRCMPCIYRRAALYRMELDTEEYGYDICTGEIPLDRDKKLADDLKACIYFLSKNYNAEQVAAFLLANGSVNIAELDAYSNVVIRAMDEIRNLLRGKAIESVKIHAGILGE